MTDVSRRSFLASASLAAGAESALAGGAQAPPEKAPAAGRSGPAAKSIRNTRSTLPVLFDGDAVVVGGSFAGVAAALQLARAGKKVVLAEPRTYLGREVCATLRPWIPAGGKLPELVLACTGRQNPYQFPPNGRAEPPREPELPLPTTGEIPLKLDKIKLVLENLLLEAGVEILFASYPLAMVREGGSLKGLIIGNKSGRQVLRCRMIVDTSETGVIARLANATFEAPDPGPAEYRRTIELEKVGTVTADTLSVPPTLGLRGNKILLHRGYRSDSHVLVEFGLDFRNSQHGPAQAMRRETAARHKTIQLVTHLVRNVPAFKEAFLAHTSYELAGLYTTKMQGPSPAWASGVGELQVGDSRVSAGAFAGPERGIWCLQESARLDRQGIGWFQEPVNATLAGESLARALLANWDRAVSAPAVEAAQQETPQPGVLDFEVREPESPQRGQVYAMQSVAPSTVPVTREVAILVVGGGTSGATAATVAAREGLPTLLIEMNPALGGTGTVAAVDSYWFGRRVGFTKQVAGQVAEVHSLIGYVPEKSNTPRWNIEAKMYALLRETERAKAEVLFNVIATGAIVEGNRVKGVMAAGRYGPFAILSDVVIDATGDGDIAAFAGADSVYCSTMDHIGMWATLAQFTIPGKNSNHFTSSVDIRNVRDYTRVILAGRRRGANCHDHGVYVAPRDTRHILGDVRLTVTDQFRQRKWPDVINIHTGNSDMKGKTTSPWLQSGLIPPNMEMEIPYRALIPKSIDNLLVTGKAISTDHDGLAGIRFQSDVENLGGVVALAAAKAVKEGKSPRRIDVAELQWRLVKEEILPKEVLTRRLRPSARPASQLKELVATMLADQPLQEYQNMEMDEVFRGRIPYIEVCTAGPMIVPYLEEALGTPRRVIAAQALSIYGSNSGVPTLVAAIEKSLEGREKVPPRSRRIRYTQLPPDQGAMHDTCYLLYNLGMARDPRAIPVWQKVAAIIHPRPEEFRDQALSPFHWVDSICFGAERLGDPAAIPILQSLHAYDTFRNLVERSKPQPDYLLERQAMCELSIAKALARCGSADGLALMIDYLEDNRTCLAEQAHSQLVRITSCDYGKDAPQWRAWLERARGSLRPRPLEHDLDIEYEQEILLA